MRLGHNFDRLIAHCSPDDHLSPIALGVSGGSDSMALLALVADWAKSCSRPVITFSVNHQLRPESKQETLRVKVEANRLGCHHETLVWTKPEPGQAAARQARHRLLGAAARRHGANILLLGHTLDDVTETMMMRARRRRRDPFIAGPALCSPSPVWPEGRNICIIRPLLFVKRGHLKHALKTTGIAWINDPSNDDHAYERTRIRRFLERHPQWHARMRAIATVKLAGRAQIEQALGAHLASPETVSINPQGLITLVASGQQCTAATLSVLIRAAGGHDRPPRAKALSQLMTRLYHSGNRYTLSGAWIQKTKTGYKLGRDPGAPGTHDRQGLWDGRYIRDDTQCLQPAQMPVLLRASAPPGHGWREIVSERIAHEAQCYQAPSRQPVHD